MIKKLGLLALLGVALVATPAGAEYSASVHTRWLVAQQRPSGAFFGDSATADQVAEVIAVLSSAGISGERISKALSYMEQGARARAKEQAAYAARIVQGLVASGQNPRDFAGANFVELMTSKYDPVIGSHGGNVYGEAIVGLGYLAAGLSLPDQYVRILRASQCSEGGFGYATGCAGKPDTDTTALVVIVLRSVPDQDSVIAKAVDWLRSMQRASGGFPHLEGEAANANSTGLVVSMLVALGLNPESWIAAEGNAQSALRQFAVAEGGIKFRYEDSKPNGYATLQALPGLLGETYPLKFVNRTQTSSRVIANPRAKESSSPSSAATATGSNQDSALGKASGGGTVLAEPQTEADRDETKVAASPPEQGSGRELWKVIALAVVGLGLGQGALIFSKRRAS